MRHIQLFMMLAKFTAAMAATAGQEIPEEHRLAASEFDHKVLENAMIALTTENTSPFQKGLTLFNSGIDWCRCVEDALSRLKRDAGYMVILMSCLKKAEKLKDLKPESIKTNFLGEVVFEDLDDRKEICSRYGSMMSATSARFKQAHN